VAAIGVADAARGTERLVVVAESGAEGRADMARVKERVAQAVIDAAGATADEVVLIRPGTLPKTANGKQRRPAVRAMYLAGTLGREPNAPWVQVTGLRLARLPALTARATRGGVEAIGRAVVRAAAALAALGGGCVARMPGLGGLAGPAARMALAIVGRSPKLEGSLPAGALVVANRCSRLDALSLAGVLPGRVALCGAESLLGLRGWARFLLGGSVIRSEQAGERLRRGDTVVVLPDGPAGAPARRCRFRLGGLQAALEAGRPVVPAAVVQVRGRTVVELAEPLAGEGGDARALRKRVREAITRLYG
jgi:hypothetical protein